MPGAAPAYAHTHRAYVVIFHAAATMAENVVYPLCTSRSPSLNLWLSHLRHVHRNDSDVCVSCPVSGCNATYKKINSFCSHMYRQHREISYSTAITAASNSSDGIGNDSDQAFPGSDNHPFVQLHTDQNLQHDIHQLCKTDSFEQRKKSSLFLLQLKEERVITQAAINDVVKGCKEVFTHTANRIKAGVKHKLSIFGIDPSDISGLDDLFNDVSDPFNGLETAYLQDKFIAQELGYVGSTAYM